MITQIDDQLNGGNTQNLAEIVFEILDVLVLDVGIVDFYLFGAEMGVQIGDVEEGDGQGVDHETVETIGVMVALQTFDPRFELPMEVIHYYALVSLQMVLPEINQIYQDSFETSSSDLPFDSTALIWLLSYTRFKSS